MDAERDHSVAERVALEFLIAYVADRDQGRVPELADYVARFPGHEELIGREFEALRAEEGSGRRIAGRYALRAEIGRGGQGVVYLARDEALGRRVALKLMPPGFGPGLPPRVRREVEAISRLDHPGIGVVYEAGEAEGQIYLAMRFVEGRSLAAFVGRPEGLGGAMEVVRVMEKVARAVHAAHVAGVVHRDLKPANIMVSADGEPVVLDFGLARSEDSTLPALTGTGDVVGTPAYMAPERLSDARSVDPRADVWSLGVTLFEVIAGVRPFEAPTYEGTIRQILGHEPPSLRRRERRLPRALEVVVATALEKAPGRRYQSAADLAEDLARVRRREPILARPVGRSERVLRWAQRHPAVAALVLLLVVVAVGGVTAAFRFRGLARKEIAARDAADLAAARWRDALAQVQRLADAKVLRELEAEADRLWPLRPERVRALDAWLARARPLVDRLAGHREALGAMRARARPYDEADRRRDHPDEFAGIMREERVLASLAAAIASEAAGARRAVLVEYRDELEKALRARRERVEALEGSSFDSIEEQWRHDVLGELVRDLDHFASSEGLLADVVERRRFAHEVVARSIDAHRERWERARAAVASNPRYRGFALAPQLGLVPLGTDPASGLEEMLHLQSHRGPLPARDGEGKLRISEDTGFVLVLVPPGRARVGAQAADPDAPHHDPAATAYEGPVQEIELQAFFLSKFETSQAQWRRLTGRTPSSYKPGFSRVGAPAITLLHPVEQVSWRDCERMLRRCDLLFPTEAQWEYAARAGTATPFWPGGPVERLADTVNLADESAARFGATWHGVPKDPTYDDGWFLHAPVNAMRPNAFGLHHVQGNVWEWCREWFAGDYRVPVLPGDGERLEPVARGRAMRGGSYTNGPDVARISNRYDTAPELRLPTLGLRPARDVR